MRILRVLCDKCGSEFYYVNGSNLCWHKPSGCERDDQMFIPPSVTMFDRKTSDPILVEHT